MKQSIKRIVTIAAVVVTAGVLILLFTFPKKQKNDLSQTNKEQREVNGFIVKPTLLVKEISVSGSLLPNEEVELRNEVAGRVVSLYLPEGKFVKQGTLLVKLFDDDLQAQLSKLKSQLSFQEQIYNRQSELMKVNGISRNEYEQAGFQVNSIKADIEAIMAQIRKTQIIAPFDGIIGLRNISPGAFVSTSTLLATIRSESRLKLDFNVPEKYATNIQPGMKVSFTLFNQNEIFYATVIATERGINSNTRNLKVRALVDNQSGTLIPGAFATVSLELGKSDSAIMVPTQAIIPQAQSKSLIIAKNGNAHFVTVKTGIRKSTMVEITEGIAAGDTVITTGLLFVKEGDKIKYSQVKDSL